MSENSNINRRKYERYVTDLKIEFQVAFDIQTKIDFRFRARQEKDFSSETYSAVSKNISAEGLCFSSLKPLARGDVLLINVYVPSTERPIRMEGEVMWSDKICRAGDKDAVYDTGVLLLKVRDQSVRESIFIDEANHVAWSNVLEAVFSSFKATVNKRKK